MKDVASPYPKEGDAGARHYRKIRPGVSQPFMQHGGIGCALLAQHCQRFLPVTGQLGEGAAVTALTETRSAASTPREAILRNIVAILTTQEGRPTKK